MCLDKWHAAINGSLMLGDTIFVRIESLLNQICYIGNIMLWQDLYVSLHMLHVIFKFAIFIFQKKLDVFIYFDERRSLSKKSTISSFLASLQ